MINLVDHVKKKTELSGAHTAYGMRFCSRDIAILDNRRLELPVLISPTFHYLRCTPYFERQYGVRGSFVDLSIVRSWLGK